jgi:hypothetical protein
MRGTTADQQLSGDGRVQRMTTMAAFTAGSLEMALGHYDAALRHPARDA